MSVLPTGIAAPTGGYEISRSVRLRSSASGYFNRTPASAGSRTVFSVSAWIKAGSSDIRVLDTGDGTSNNTTRIVITNSSSLNIVNISGGSVNLEKVSTRVFRDPSAWGHLLVTFNSGAVKAYWNNEEITSWSTNTNTLGSSNTMVNATNAHYINRASYTAAYGDFYITEVNFIDGQALTPSSFGETDVLTGVWKPKAFSGTYGTNGFYLNFSDNSAATAAAIGKDSSGNGNNWTPNNISVTSGVTYDSMLDVPTMGGAGSNHCVMNPLDKDTNLTLSDGNLTVTGYNAGGSASFGLTSGKWYWEVTLVNDYAANNWGLHGVSSGKPNSYISGYTGYPTGAGVWANTSGGSGGTWASGSLVSGSTTWANGDVLGLAFDAANLTLDVYRNNVKIGTTLTVPSGAIYPTAYQNGTSGDTSSSAYNFGQRPFASTPPTGFKALNTQNLPDATIKKGNQYFDATTYTGNGTSQSIVNAGGFQPDLVWLKGRNAVSDNSLYDAIRGVTKELVSNTTTAEATVAQGLTSFNANGFSLGTAAWLNTNSNTYVGWQWKESVSAGFDIVTYTGTGSARTIAHSLGVKPSMIIIKNRSSATDWPTWHQNLPNPTTQHFWLNATNAAQTSGSFNSTQPTSSVFSVGTTTEANGNTHNLVAYLFAEVTGYSKFGSYTGNGSTDGPFVYLGFRPKCVFIKRTDSAGNWYIYDSVRDAYNAVSKDIYPNLSNAESENYPTVTLDIVSNGFKLRRGGVDQNASGGTYIYAAFAENPFKNSLAR